VFASVLPDNQCPDGAGKRAVNHHATGFKLAIRKI
tara:strand:+ start:837 stop:941 length:105 start_codon:yes stop_codon:yes gene_type:complete